MFPFNVRVYGVLLDEKLGVLISDEIIRGRPFTKFPGGGLEWGEGTRDCLKREFMEEMNLDVLVGEHLYTTDFFQLSAWNSTHQVLSIYYYVQPTDSRRDILVNTVDGAAAPRGDVHNEEVFRFIPWDLFNEHALTLPIDKVVAGMLEKLHGEQKISTL